MNARLAISIRRIRPTGLPGGAAAWLVCLVWLALAFCPPAAASPPDRALVLDERESYRLGTHLDLYQDPTGHLGLSELLSPDFKGSFRPSQVEVPNLGITSGACWVRFTLQNGRPQPATMLLAVQYPPLDRVTLFAPQDQGGYRVLEAGDAVAHPQVAMEHRHYLFELNLPPGVRRTYYLRVVNPGAMTLPLTLSSYPAFYRHDYRDQVSLGILFGLVAGAIIYFLYVAVRLKYPAALWFSIYLACLGLVVTAGKGYFQELLRPHLTLLSNLLQLVAVGLLYFSGAKFLRVFLEIARRSPRVDRVLWVLQWMGVFYVPVCVYITPFTHVYSLVLVGLGPLFSTGVAIYFWSKGVPNAKYFALGWLVGHLVSVLDLARIYGVIPFLPITAYAAPAALCTALVFFSRALVAQTGSYQRQAREDGLTGLANRRGLMDFMQREWNRARRARRPLGLVILDLDHFKQYNDQYGHDAGDRCLVRVSRTLADFARREGELAGRYGGEEFVLVLADADADQALELAAKVRQAINDLGIPHLGQPSGRVTVSAGAASLTPDQHTDPQDLLRAADRALYQAKEQGRDQVRGAPVQ